MTVYDLAEALNRGAQVDAILLDPKYLRLLIPYPTIGWFISSEHLSK